MKTNIVIKISGAMLAAGALVCAGAQAQQKTNAVVQQNRAYNLAREVSIQGAVSSFTAKANSAPLGAHVTVQTGSGAVDVQLGDARLLSEKQMTLATGDSIRVIGETVRFGAGSTQFVARLVVKGNQSVALRSTRGFPLKPGTSTATNEQASRGGVL